MLDFNGVQFLLSPHTLEDLAGFKGLKLEPLSLSKSDKLKKYSIKERRLIVEQIMLRERAKEKFSNPSKMVFSKIGLEQSTREILSKYKAKKINRDNPSVADLCCGIGGDSLFLENKVVGVDHDLPTLKLYKYNLSQLGKDHRCILGKAENCSVKADAALVDPSRRHKSGNWGVSNLSPSLEKIESIIQRYGNVSLKLGPGTQLPEQFWEYEVEFLGVGDDCLEMVVWTGNLGKKGWVSAVQIDSGKEYSCPKEEILSLAEGEFEVGTFIYEPVKVMVRSHLFGLLANEMGLKQMDGRIAYLTGQEKLDHPMLKGYKIIDNAPIQLRKLQHLLQKHHVGTLEIKKRGVSLKPEELRKQLKLKGDRKAVLVLTRVNNKKTAFLCSALKSQRV